MITYKTLEGTCMEVLYQSFLKAFSDYQVNINMPIDRFISMLERRGYVPELSVGAFEGNKMVGFVLNGIRSWDKKLTAYDCGTGVIPDYRKKGISSGIFSEVMDILRKNKIEQYLLEVIQTNTPAVELYKKIGFCISRSFSCYCLQKPEAFNSIEDGNLQVVDLANIKWSIFKNFWDFSPSWQNSIDSILVHPHHYIAILFKEGDDIKGYGIINKYSGDIPQFAVCKSSRNEGIGQRILKGLLSLNEGKKATVINVEHGYYSVTNLLTKLGFEKFAEQYEMVLKV